MTKIREYVRLVVISLRYILLTKVYGMKLSKTCRISYGAKLDKTNPRGINIDDESYVASGAIIFSHDFSRNIKVDTYIGKRCFIGANAIIMPGIRLGDEVIVGSGAVVTKDVLSHCIVAGNPAKVIRTSIKTEKFGRIVNNVSESRVTSVESVHDHRQEDRRPQARPCHARSHAPACDRSDQGRHEGH